MVNCLVLQATDKPCKKYYRRAASSFIKAEAVLILEFSKEAEGGGGPSVDQIAIFCKVLQKLLSLY